MKTQLEIGQAIKAYFASKGLSIVEAAAALGLQPQSLSNICTGRRKIGKAVAARFAAVYGFSQSFLMLGEGELFASAAEPQKQQDDGGIYIPAELVRMFNNMAETIRSQQADLSAQRGLRSGNPSAGLHK